MARRGGSGERGLPAHVAWLIEALHERIARAVASWALTFLPAIGSFDRPVTR